ncbi:Fur family transcriptional regulator [Amylibacter kogurei]|uniref:Fur family transcriptional regulator n=1 Tax=Paramylibacter kogurei TaxID=1889778 RepID=A0A2G5K0X9_9RHOB|nr:transcriptional repressor [Amylibacter kogurei]PIB23161.1 Fur family transcriptional regulator [Amylibacter kogurei]
MSDQIKTFRQHNHDNCVESAMHAAQDICDAQHLKLTPARQRVLEILLESHTALGAYDILERLSNEGGKAQPPVVYRALDFLVGNGLAHKIEQLNAFVACVHSHKDHNPAFMICKKCKRVAETEIPNVPTALNQHAMDSGFVIEQTIIEARGICPSCNETAK